MSLFRPMNLSIRKQFLIALLIPVVIVVAFSMAHELVGYKVVALILMVSISIQALAFGIWPVLVSATASALMWNFIFIPPAYSFHIANTEDSLLFLMYFLIALINAVLTSRVRKYEQKIRDRDEKEKTLNLYNTIINSLSHELRTPISSIIGSVDTLLVNKNKLSDEIQEKLLLEIEQAGDRLNNQVENLLNMSRLDSGTIRLTTDWLDLEEFFHQLPLKIHNYRNHQWIVNAPQAMPLIKADHFLLEQACLNILRNAAQYTPPGTSITMNLDYSQTACSITISDQGPGFPPDSIPFIFEKFFRLPDTKTGGTGLGLSIAKGFIHAMGGEIILQNNKDGGAGFCITLPAEMSFINDLSHPGMN